ncbi:site-2 protease family protein [Hymenobacter setariae]|uniref:site-2 protease family protein n=1 Tax=Hymenobacter setariae TaxID=2594794 RepID=UPI001F3809F4|nr:site-2 protease family protein [Hymenobacter setariae]
MSFPKNLSDSLPTPPPDDEPLGGFPADASAPPTLAWGQRLFRRYERPPSRLRTAAIHLGLFVLTLATTVLAGVSLTRGGLDFIDFSVFSLPAAVRAEELGRGLTYALAFLGVLTVHEFGHYFVARYNRVSTSLPYYIPFPLGLGTFGAVIRIREAIYSRREFFDIGLAGPLAGLVVAVGVLAYGFTHLPDPLAYVQHIHPEFVRLGADYAQGYQGEVGLTLSRPLLYQLLERWLADPTRLPHPNELLHYPVLVAGELSLFFTALNLIPIGQLDGGHILYGLLGPRRAGRLSGLLFVAFIFYAGLGLFSLHSGWHTWLYGAAPYALYLWLVFRKALPRPRQVLALGALVWAGQLAVATLWPAVQGQPGWLLFGLLLGRVSGLYHPRAPDERPLNLGRQVLGWTMVLLFVLCFSPSPFAGLR